jgi:predicted small integral membrane protein
MFSWMVWTTPVAVFFTCIVLMLIGMTVWELKSPTVERKGFLPLRTTRGDRLFIGLMAAWHFWVLARKRWSGCRWMSRHRCGSALWRPCCCWLSS